MSFQPFVLGSGLVAWRNLQRTMPQQMKVFANSSEQKRLTEHFEQSASELKTAGDLVSDRRSLRVALGAYGLQDDLNNTYFVKRIISEGGIEPSALANRMSDSRYQRLASDLAMDGLTQFTGILPAKVQKISEQFIQQSFNAAVGEQQPNLRLALNAEQELIRLAQTEANDRTKWFLVMGNPPLRAVFEKALNLPTAMGRLDIEQQLGIFQAQAEKVFGSSGFDTLTDPENSAKIIDRFLIRDQIQAGNSMNGQSIALQMLAR